MTELRFNWRPEYALQPKIIDVTAHETALIKIPLTDQDLSQMSFYDELGRQEAARQQAEQSAKGKTR